MAVLFLLHAATDVVDRGVGQLDGVEVVNDSGGVWEVLGECCAVAGRRVQGGQCDLVTPVRAAVGHTVSITVEIDRLDQIESAIEGGADIVLLDNLRGDDLRRAVELVDGRAVTEASGSVTIDTVAEVAASGVDVISLGWITHSAPRLDVALDL